MEPHRSRCTASRWNRGRTGRAGETGAALSAVRHARRRSAARSTRAARQLLAGFLRPRLTGIRWRPEVDRFLALYDSRRRARRSLRGGVKLALKAVLVSPPFLFRIEEHRRPAFIRLGQYELASRLSYFLWSTMPDDELTAWPRRGGCRIPKCSPRRWSGCSTIRARAPSATASSANGWARRMWAAAWFRH